MKLTLITILITISACAPIKVETKSKPVQTVSSGTINVVVSGNVHIWTTVAIQADPAINSLVSKECNQDQVCADKTMSDIIVSVTQTLTNLGVSK